MKSRLAPRDIVSTADVAPRPWPNGGGAARDLLMWPSADDWRVRVALADIEADGPFSTYPKVQRVIAIVGGGGLELSIGGALHHVKPGAREGVVFDGGAVTTCRRLTKKTSALNLFLRGVTGTIRPLAAGAAWAPRSPVCGLYTLQAGTCRHVDEETELPDDSLLWFDLAPPILTFSRDAWAIEISKTAPSAAVVRR
ncbi:MAG: HutD family protein [Caldimonas sp.]